MSNKSVIVDTISVCECCMLVHANGECCSGPGHGGDGRVPLSEITEGYSVTMGLVAKDHADGCTESDREHGRCECEGPWFSWSRCEGCGSFLSGNRYALTLWKDS